jgi:hypothetical protein
MLDRSMQEQDETRVIGLEKAAFGSSPEALDCLVRANVALARQPHSQHPAQFKLSGYVNRERAFVRRMPALSVIILGERLRQYGHARLFVA